MPPFLVRPALAEDREAILALMVAVIRSSIDDQLLDEMIENVTKNLGIWSRDPDSCVHLVAEASDGSLIGVVLVKEFWNLSSLFVMPSHQRQGLGRKLVLAAVERCRGRSPIAAINLNSAPHATKFYTSLGFVPREPSRPLPPGFIAMRLALGEA